MAPARHLDPQGPHRVAGPSGPGFRLPPTSLNEASHQPQRQLPPSQDRLWAARPPSVSWTLPQPVRKSKFYGAFVPNHRVVLDAIDATPAR